MELHKLHLLKHPPKLPDGPVTYQLLIVRVASQSGSVLSVDFPSWESLARRLTSGLVGKDELQEAKAELDVNRYYKMVVSLSPAQIELLRASSHELTKPRSL